MIKGYNSMMREPKYPVQTVMKAIEIINHLAKDTSGRGVAISEFSRVLGLGKSTVHRILDTLQFYGYIDQDAETNRYRLGWELYKIGQVIPQQNQLFNINQSLLVDLSNKTQEVVNLGTLKRNETVIISKIESPRTGLRVSVNPGEYEAIHATALGKMMISEMDADQIQALFNNEDQLPTHTPNTISTVSELLKEVKMTRQRGYAVDAEELCLGLYCMAMPVRDYTGKIVAAISVSSAASRINDETKKLILESLEETTRKVSESLGYSF